MRTHVANRPARSAFPDERSQRIADRLERRMLVTALLTAPAIVIENIDLDVPWPTVGTEVPRRPERHAHAE